MLNTLKTTAGYVVTLVAKYTPLKAHKTALEDIYNYLPVSERLSTSGQPSEAQFRQIKAAGFTTVINLAPHNAENSLDDEAGVLRELGLRYIHIPVNFKNPKQEKFDAFVSAMESARDQKVWLHCAANMRASAFLYRYRRDILQDDAEAARKAMETIWEPFGVWKEFVKKR